MAKPKLELINPYEILPEKYIQKKRSYPNFKEVQVEIPMRGLVIGPCGSGKTQIVYNIVSNIGAFTHVYLFVKDPEEPIYKYLIDTLTELGRKKGVQLISFSNNIADIPEVEFFDKKKNNLVVFDDMLCEKEKGKKNGNDRILDLYVRGRRQNCSVIYVTQSYYDTPSLVRKNANYIFIKRVDTVDDLNRILREYSLGVKMLFDYYDIAVETPKSFLLIDKITTNKALKIRNGWWPFEKEKQD